MSSVFLPMDRFLAGDLAGAIQCLEEASERLGQENEISDFVERLRSRFFGGIIVAKEASVAEEAGDFGSGPRESSFSQVTQAYRGYWKSVLGASVSRTEAETRLFNELSILLDPSSANSVTDQDSLEGALIPLLERAGVFSLFGTVSPFLSFLAWRKQEEKTFRVETLSGIVETPVHELSEFEELGWLAYATFGMKSVGGWANEKGVFAVMPAWNNDLNSERFQSQFLKHEAQHFFDNKEFPWMKGAQLEFRAKLNEVFFAERPEEALKRFQVESAPDFEIPHCFAAFLVVKRLENSGTELLSRIRTEFELSSDPVWLSAAEAESKRL